MSKRLTITETADAEAKGRNWAAPAKERPDRTRIVAVRLSPDEHRRLRLYFEAQGIPASTGVRSLILNHMRDQGA